MNFDITTAIANAIENHAKTIENATKNAAIAAMPNDGYLPNDGNVELSFEFDDDENIGIAAISPAMPILKSILIESARDAGGVPVEWDDTENTDVLVLIFDRVGAAQLWIMQNKYDALIDDFEIEKNEIVIYVNENAEYDLFDKS